MYRAYTNKNISGDAAIYFLPYLFFYPSSGPGPKWARAQVGPGPSGPRAQVGPGPKWARAQVGPGPSWPGPKWAWGPSGPRAQVGPGIFISVYIFYSINPLNISELMRFLFMLTQYFVPACVGSGRQAGFESCSRGVCAFRCF